MKFVPALKMLANDQIDDVRPIIMKSVNENEFNTELCFKICENIL